MTTTARRPSAPGTISLLVLVGALASGCAGKGDPGADGRSVALRTASVAPGTACPSGGVEVETGVDLDRDGLLDDGEVGFSAFVCHGADGSDVQVGAEQPGVNCPQGGVVLTAGAGAPTYLCDGAPGPAGQEGQSVSATPEPPGTSCPFGGERLQVGAGTPTFVCNGAPGTNGQDGSDGQGVAMTAEPPGASCELGGVRLQVGAGTPTYVCNGAPGADGQAGQDGQSVSTTPESPGASCAYGGQRLQVGAATPTYVCNGAPGAAGQDGRAGESVAVTSEPAGASCEYGGERLQVGTGTPTYVCNGAPGAAGQDGQPGQDGASVAVTPESPGAQCDFGGQRLQVGTGTPTYVCNGAPGAAGQDGHDGQAGESVAMTIEPPGASCEFGGERLQVGTAAPTYVCNGAPGAAGQDGESVAVTPEAPGASCAAGGQRLQVGSGAPTYVCNGAPGATGQDGESVAMTPEAPGANCGYGGQRLQIGSGTPTYVCDGAPGATGQDGESVAMTPEAPGASCEYGGQRLQIGSGTPSYVCNGAPGATGATGATGASGQDGQSVAVTPEAPGANCEHGGQRLQVGAGTPSYVCDGAPGATGQDGQSVTMTPEPPGASCEFGGVKLQVGSGPEAYLCSGAAAGATRPLVETSGVSGIRYTEASVSSLVASDGNELVLARGVALATHPDPTLRDTVFLSSSASASFTTACRDLAPGTTYWVRAFATNALGTGYGAERSFTTLPLSVPTLAAAPVSNVTPSTAIAGGDVTDDGGSPILGRGVCWSLAAAPTLADTCADEGVGAGAFIALVTGLAGDTTYHVRAYAVNAQGTGYGPDVAFTTVVWPLATLTTSAPSAISYTTATSGGSVLDANGTPVTSRGICWATTPAPTTAGSTWVEPAGLGSFTAGLSGLAPSTRYYVRAFAVNGGGTSYGNEVSFTTLAPVVPSLSTRAIAGVSSYLAGSGGTIATDGGSPITAKGVCWSLNPNPTVANSRTTDGTGPASFNSTLTGLEPLTTYHVRAYATNALGTAYGNDVTFTTTDLATPGPTVPVVGTSATTIATGTTASSGGYVSTDGGSPVVARGVCWSTSPNPTVAGACSTDGGSGLGYFAATVTGLAGCNVVYYVRAFATNATGTGYGNQNTVTAGISTTVGTDPASAVGYYGATSGGTIADEGGCPITQRGVVFGLSPGPTLANGKTTDGPGFGAFASTLTGLFANRTYYLRAYATSSAGTGYGPQVVFTTLEPTTPYVGQSYGGGIVFHVDGTGLHGFVAAAADQGLFPWGCLGTSIPTSTALGAGASNTAAIIANCGEAGIAAKVADGLVLNGYDDWFLPSRDEYSLMRGNLTALALGSFGNLNSTSSQTDATNALLYWYGNLTQIPKTQNAYVRPIRAF